MSSSATRKARSAPRWRSRSTRPRSSPARRRTKSRRTLRARTTPTRTSSVARSIGKGRLARPFFFLIALELEREREAVAQRELRELHAGVGMHQVVEGTNRARVLVLARRVREPAVPQRVVHCDHAAGSQQLEAAFVVAAVAGLVGVDEGEVVLSAAPRGDERVERLERRRDPQVDLLLDPRL